MAKPDPKDPVTRGMLDEAVDAILEGVSRMFTKVDKRFDKVGERLYKFEVGQAHLTDQIQGLTADLSDTPSQREFEKLKARVDKYHPLT